MKFKPADPAPLTVRQISVYLKQHGVEKTLELVRSVPGTRPNWVAGAANALVAEGDTTVAMPALRWAVQEYPKSTLYEIWLAQALVATGDRAGALAAYRKAAELFPHDETINTELARQNYKYMIDKGMKDLGAHLPSTIRALDRNCLRTA